MESEMESVRTEAFSPLFTVDLALAKVAKDFVRLPSGRSPREAEVGHLEVGPLHNFLEKIPFFSAKSPTDFTFTEAIGCHQIRMLFYSRFSVRVTKLLLLSCRPGGFTE
jgi:hypothetical protein